MFMSAVSGVGFNPAVEKTFGGPGTGQNRGFARGGGRRASRAGITQAAAARARGRGAALSSNNGSSDCSLSVSRSPSASRVHAARQQVLIERLELRLDDGPAAMRASGRS
jgi:hypothetical protein